MLEFLSEFVKENVTITFIIALLATLFLLIISVREQLRFREIEAELNITAGFESTFVLLGVSSVFLFFYLATFNKKYEGFYYFILGWAICFAITFLSFMFVKCFIREESKKQSKEEYRRLAGLPEEVNDNRK